MTEVQPCRKSQNPVCGARELWTDDDSLDKDIERWENEGGARAATGWHYPLSTALAKFQVLEQKHGTNYWCDSMIYLIEALKGFSWGGQLPGRAN